MKTLVVYYSRTGLTKKIAMMVSDRLKADLDEVIDKKDRSGALGYIAAGKAAMKKELTTITCSRDPKDYDMVLIGGPVWAWTMSPAIRTYLDKNTDSLKIKKVAFFATQGNSGSDKKFQAMGEMLGMKPIALLSVDAKDFRSDAHEKKVVEFISMINNAK